MARLVQEWVCAFDCWICMAEREEAMLWLRKNWRQHARSLSIFTEDWWMLAVAEAVVCVFSHVLASRCCSTSKNICINRRCRCRNGERYDKTDTKLSFGVLLSLSLSTSRSLHFSLSLSPSLCARRKISFRECMRSLLLLFVVHDRVADRCQNQQQYDDSTTIRCVRVTKQCSATSQFIT